MFIIRKENNTRRADATTHHLYASGMIFYLCLRRIGSEVCCRLAGHGLQLTVAPKVKEKTITRLFKCPLINNIFSLIYLKLLFNHPLPLWQERWNVFNIMNSKKWHPSQEGDLNMCWHENQDSSSGRTPG